MPMKRFGFWPYSELLTDLREYSVLRQCVHNPGTTACLFLGLNTTIPGNLAMNHKAATQLSFASLNGTVGSRSGRTRLRTESIQIQKSLLCADHSDWSFSTRPR